MSGEPDGDEPAVSTGRDEPEASTERRANQDCAADLEIIRQVELGDEIMDEYGETFSALAKPANP